MINETKSVNTNNPVNTASLKDLKKEFKANKKVVVEPIKALVNSENKEPLSTVEKITALILLLTVGFLGVHKFYLGQIGLGILYLFTGGLFGIVLLIYLINLLTNNSEQ